MIVVVRITILHTTDCLYNTALQGPLCTCMLTDTMSIIISRVLYSSYDIQYKYCSLSQYSTLFYILLSHRCTGQSTLSSPSSYTLGQLCDLIICTHMLFNTYSAQDFDQGALTKLSMVPLHVPLLCNPLGSIDQCWTLTISLGSLQSLVNHCLLLNRTLGLSVLYQSLYG